MVRKGCPECGGTGWKAVVADGVRRVSRCACWGDARAHQLLQQARIPPRYEHCALENFDIRKDKESGRPNPSLGAAKLNAQRFVEEYPVDFGLLFVGPTGVGKTHLAVAVLRELIDRKGIECLFYDFLTLLKDIRGSYNPISETTELSVLQPVVDIEVLLLDELTTSDPTSWVKETLQHIINARYNQKKVTMITTTLPLVGSSGRREVRMPSGETMPEIERSLSLLGPTLQSRLHEMCKLVEMNSDDYRKSIKQAGYKFRVE